MTARVRLFAILRERAGTDTVEVELPERATVADVLSQLALRPELTEPIERMPLRLAVNREYAAAEAPVVAGDELALIPPISGGAGVHAAIREEPLDGAGLTGLVADPGAGAIVSFQGVTREVARLDYEAYGEMAKAGIAAILIDCRERHGLLGVAAEHRVGTVGLGEPAVIVAVSAPHRDEAFAGAREAIDRIKAELPIWKREVEAGGEARWVDGTPAPEATA